jgi:DNA-binding NarL/FixJ family response regulator
LKSGCPLDQSASSAEAVEFHRTPMPIRVVVADDHPLILNALEHLLGQEGDFELVARCGSGEEALQAVLKHDPDVAVVDLRMPGLDGLAVLRQIRAQNLRTRVVLLAASVEEEELLDAARLGVRGVVLKEMAPRLLLQCIRKAHAGEIWLERRAAARAFEKLLRREAGALELSKVLTPREIEVLRLTASGLRNKAIAEQLSVVEGTVKTHLHSIYEKLKVGSRAQLIFYCRDKGLI